MERVPTERLKQFENVVHRYNQCFYNRNTDALKSMYVRDADVKYWDNHANCDSPDLIDHLTKVGGFFESLKLSSAPVEEVLVEGLTVWADENVACMTMMMRYSLKPKPGVRTTCVLESAGKEWLIRHMHFSVDPTEQSREDQVESD